VLQLAAAAAHDALAPAVRGGTFAREEHTHRVWRAQHPAVPEFGSRGARGGGVPRSRARRRRSRSDHTVTRCKARSANVDSGREPECYVKENRVSLGSRLVRLRRHGHTVTASGYFYYNYPRFPCVCRFLRVSTNNHCVYVPTCQRIITISHRYVFLFWVCRTRDHEVL
jgi:hypothetical protein